MLEQFERYEIQNPHTIQGGNSGRSHLNGQGIPPDGPIRTSYDEE
jgi:hypothetical protein